MYVDQPERLFGLSPLTDQKLAGVVMMVEQALTLGLALVLLVRMARRSRGARGVTRRRAGLMPSPWSFSFEPLFLVLAAVAVALYVRAWRGAPGPWWRAASFAGGIALVVGALNSPLGTIATEYLVLFHLLQNVMISRLGAAAPADRADAGDALGARRAAEGARSRG